MENWFLEVGGVYNKFFTRNIFIKDNEIDKYRDKFNNRDYYATIYNYKDTVDKGPLTAPFYLDIDNHNFLNNEEEFAKVKRDTIIIINTLNIVYKIPIDSIQIFFSGNKGFHLIIPIKIFGIQEDNRLNEIYYKFAKEIQTHTLFDFVDLRYDRRRLFRVINSINSESNLYKIQISYQELKNLKIDILKKMAKKPRQVIYNNNIKISTIANEKFNEYKEEVYHPKKEKSFRFNRRYNKMLPCILNVLENGVKQGNRNNVTVAIASSLLQKGMPYEDVLDKVIIWNSEKNSPALNSKEVERAVKSALKELRKGFRYGCTKMKEYDYCIPKKCGNIK